MFKIIQKNNFTLEVINTVIKKDASSKKMLNEILFKYQFFYNIRNKKIETCMILTQLK